jgi:uncharacterized membrane-anchored protein
MRQFLSALLCLALCAPLMASAAPEAASAPKMTAEQFIAGLQFQQGKINLPGNIATLDLPPSFRYLPPADAGRLLTEGWGNPPGAQTLGMILPSAVSPLSAAGWGVIITYDKDGHVNDADADSIDYSKLLKEMQESMTENNSARKEQGYGAMNLVGWAEKPSYDKAHHKLYWAKELQTEGSNENSLNYNVRVLGREGVLVLNAVAGMNQIAEIKSEMKNVTAFTDFTPGNSYADFNSSTDKVAEYGLAALVAGGVAAKMGLFGKLFVLLLAFKKIILIGVAAVGGWLYKLFSRKREEKAAAKVTLEKNSGIDG